MNQADLMLARTQMWMIFIYTICIFGLVFALIFFHSHMDSVEITILTNITSVLLTVLVLQNNFFFARQRPQALPDPSLPTNGTATITTKIDSTKTVVTPPLAPTQPGATT
jgi:hypothetical protein